MPRISTYPTQFSLSGATSTNAVTFNGTTQYGVLSASYSALQTLGDFTIEYWMNESGSNPSYTSWWELGSATTGYATGYNDNSFNNITGQVNTATIAFSGNSSAQWTAGTWVHIAHIWNSSTLSVTNVVNGIQISNSFFQAGNGALPTWSNTLLYIAEKNLGTADFIGSFACIRIWNYQRAVADILSHKNYYLDPTREVGLILNLNFIEASGTTVANTATGGTSMNLIANPSWSAGPTLNTWIYPVRSQTAQARTQAIGLRTTAT